VNDVAKTVVGGTLLVSCVTVLNKSGLSESTHNIAIAAIAFLGLAIIFQFFSWLAEGMECPPLKNFAESFTSVPPSDQIHLLFVGLSAICLVIGAALVGSITG
jgi:hypothetical protein